MITRIEAKQYRCFKSMNQELGQFQILVGPNGSGKSLFLDTIAFLGTYVSEGLEVAVGQRTENFHDLVWGREGNCFEFAIEARRPRRATAALAFEHSTIRYELGVKIDSASDQLKLAKENAIFSFDDPEHRVKLSNPRPHFRHEDIHGAEFQAFEWLNKLLREDVRSVVLSSKLLRAPSAPARGNLQTIDGSNLGRLVFQLQDESPKKFDRWIAHVRTALPDLDSIRSILRPEDRSRYLILKYQNGVEAPQWVISDGTLRLLAFTILAYLPVSDGIYLVEEPENGVHPTALETIYQSLSSIYGGQVLVTSHSPVLLNLASPDQLLCFYNTAEGPAIIRGDKHPALQDWKRDVSMSDLFAAGVLG
jgi:predicted ATPase